MRFKKLFVVIGVAILASVVACGLLLISSSAPYSSPEKSITAFVDAESQADLSAMEKPASRALYQNFIGRFGEAKYREVRNIYQEAYDLAEPKWEQYRDKARAAAEKEHQSIAEEISKSGQDAFRALPADKRLQIIDDRPRFNEFIFEEGLKALPAKDRGKIVDPQAFRENKDLNAFTDREGFALLPEEDRNGLEVAGSPVRGFDSRTDCVHGEHRAPATHGATAANHRWNPVLRVEQSPGVHAALMVTTQRAIF